MSSLIANLWRLAKAAHRASADPEFHALVLIMIVLLMSGTTFYVLHENWGIVDALYFCVMTMATIGYGDLTPSTAVSKLFTIVYAFVAIGVFVAVASKLASAMIQTYRHHGK